MAVILGSISAQAYDWNEITEAEIAHLRTHKNVVSMLNKVGARDFTVTEVRNNLYEIATDNNCSFHARIAYGDFGYNPTLPNKGIDNVFTSNSSCQ